jgi:acetyl/propionyl-CoA carboxylase alpha subunit
VPPFYDSLLAKIISHAPERAAAIAGLRQALGSTRVVGVATNLAFHGALLGEPQFQAGAVDTGFVARLLERGLPSTETHHG